VCARSGTKRKLAQEIPAALVGYLASACTRPFPAGYSVAMARHTPLALLPALILTIVGMTPSPAVAQPRPLIFDPNTLAWSDDPGPTLDTLAGLGTDVVRLRVAYADAPDFAPLDRAVAGVLARGMQPLLTPVGPAPSQGAFTDFVGQLGRRYPQVSWWAICNEPDLFPLPGHDWNPELQDPQLQPPEQLPIPDPPLDGPPMMARESPGADWNRGLEYRQIFDAAQLALEQTGHPRRQVLIGETSPVARPAFIRAVLSRPLIARGWAHHPYALAIAGMPTMEPWRRRPGYFGSGDMAALGRLLAPRHLAIYATEFGARDPRTLAAATWVLRRSAVRSLAQYTLVDDAFGTGLLTAGGVPKAQLQAFLSPRRVLHSWHTGRWLLRRRVR
jgi:hypothetical protein